MEPQTQLTALGKSQEAQKVMGLLSTPTKGSEAPGGEPWTPTSNLKMLISAASLEIRNREKVKNSAEETENSSQVTVTEDANTARVPSVGFIYILVSQCTFIYLFKRNVTLQNVLYTIACQFFVNTHRVVSLTRDEIVLTRLGVI